MRWFLATIAVGVTASSGAAAQQQVEPDWLRKPTGEELWRYYPRRAMEENASGRATISCGVNTAGEPVDCKVVDEAPRGLEFGAAAVKLGKTFRMKPRTIDGKPVAGGTVQIPIVFSVPDSPVVGADWANWPTGKQIAAALPERARSEDVGGAADIDCLAAADGRLSDCKVVAERAPGYGFGAAALGLAALYQVGPSQAGGRVKIPVVWPVGAGWGYRDASRDPVLPAPIWASVPSAAAMKAAFPAGATTTPFGNVVLHCNLDSEGRLRRCATKTGSAFGLDSAAKSLVGGFKLRYAAADAAKMSAFWVDVPFRFRNSSATEPLNGGEVRLIRSLTPDGANRLYPVGARAEGIVTGLGVADCAANESGFLVDCRVLREDPPGKGFGEAALGGAREIQINPWTSGGEPVEGRRVTLPFRFNYAAPAAPAAP